MNRLQNYAKIRGQEGRGKYFQEVNYITFYPC